MFHYAKHIQASCRKEPRQCRAQITESIANRQTDRDRLIEKRRTNIIIQTDSDRHRDRKPVIQAQDTISLRPILML